MGRLLAKITVKYAISKKIKIKGTSQDYVILRLIFWI